ncbi:DUF3019 domain-containing protein [Motilimonas cestriensis]|uniref:DUF3019 domain-containing protein n=1 Tax=Motilimonas cestriensis TaxID=2742685 RepID=A0ABS8W9N4_9GAMM|nr:DUF3019 domain-containing protein [Motilimonas cestriensis]MCE2594471.1 DUF3019 domain-containing protein [Motilimonas cestriensis]
MYFKPLFLFLMAFALMSFMPSLAYSKTLPSTDYISVKPEKCVALREGRQCLADVAFDWQTAVVGDYCLVEKEALTVVRCWQGTSSGRYRLAFSKQQTTQFLLVVKDTNRVVLETEVEVSWVYKTKHKKRRWRLF